MTNDQLGRDLAFTVVALMVLFIVWSKWLGPKFDALCHRDSQPRSGCSMGFLLRRIERGVCCSDDIESNAEEIVSDSVEIVPNSDESQVLHETSHQPADLPSDRSGRDIETALNVSPSGEEANMESSDHLEERKRLTVLNSRKSIGASHTTPRIFHRSVSATELHTSRLLQNTDHFIYETSVTPFYHS
ncbi:hypothetical protein MPTK1_8g05450 [Marchantia polymorpha subsp. ruderalis]|uniref:Uncharacterized protein n=1 Tax=Marchantia polymorpha TaxID=3197 RepID=A0A2R6WKD8_MARPO|nr:hypothetical protein MARPO_0081s0046 [Marchantia polymorpha]BBN18780.1 hypothetical protein Mp_8g05450 [Marchantia polymorpha subsp. ruderalis]|eukprot:PTQ34319.1 hypothetical protein MARPO_0081s0046 [Marchantia polymorpha]